jgi:hypothetical protein
MAGPGNVFWCRYTLRRKRHGRRGEQSRKSTFETIKNIENTLQRSNKRQQMIIPGMVRVGCQRVSLGTLGAGVVMRRVGHGGSERVSIIKN